MKPVLDSSTIRRGRRPGREGSHTGEDEGIMGTAGESLRDFVDRVVRSIVNHPEEVKVSAIESETMIVIELAVGDLDLGQVIGKEGRMAQSLRILVIAMAMKLGKRGVLQILENR